MPHLCGTVGKELEHAAGDHPPAMMAAVMAGSAIAWQPLLMQAGTVGRAQQFACFSSVSDGMEDGWATGTEEGREGWVGGWREGMAFNGAGQDKHTHRRSKNAYSQSRGRQPAGICIPFGWAARSAHLPLCPAGMAD